LQDNRGFFIDLRFGVDDSGKLSLAFVSLVVMIDHAPELVVVLADAFIFGYFISIGYDLQRFHVEVVFEGKVDIYFAGPHK